MPSPVVTLALDLTGQSTANRIVNEHHVLQNSANRLIVPVFGAFFGESVQVTDTATALPLQHTQYRLMDLYQEGSLDTGKDVYNVVIITDAAVSQHVEITYQALGGPFCRDRQGLIDWLASRVDDSGSIDWSDLKDRPKRYNPAGHNLSLIHI